MSQLTIQFAWVAGQIEEIQHIGDGRSQEHGAVITAEENQPGRDQGIDGRAKLRKRTRPPVEFHFQVLHFVERQVFQNQRLVCSRTEGLAKREQALSTANAARTRAANAVPAHKQVVESEKRRSAVLEQQLVSIQKRAANPEHAAYCASKGGIHALTRAMAIDLGKDNIRVNAIAPGWIRTELSDDYINAQQDPETAWEDLYKMHPAGRIGEPEDVGKLAIYLASDDSTFVTGQVIVIDGGRTSKLPLPF